MAVIVALATLLTHAEPQLKDPNDLLWLLHNDRRKLDVEDRGILEKLERGRVPTIERAMAEAIRFRLGHGGLLADEGSRVVALFRIGIDSQPFAASGDLVWVVRFSRLLVGVTQEVWINSASGEVRALLPLPERSK